MIIITWKSFWNQKHNKKDLEKIQCGHNHWILPLIFYIENNNDLTLTIFYTLEFIIKIIFWIDNWHMGSVYNIFCIENLGSLKFVWKINI